MKNSALRELAEGQQKKTKEYKSKARELKRQNEELMLEIKKLNVSHPNQTIKEEKKEYSDLLGENNSSETEEIFKLKKNYKILQEKLDEEVTKSEVLKVIAEGEKQKFEKVISKYQDAQNINDDLINKLKKKDEDFKEEIDNINKQKNLEQNNEKEKEKEKEKNKLNEELKEKNKIIKGLNDNIEELKNKNKKLISINEEQNKKIKELNNQIEEYKNKIKNYKEENDNDNENDNPKDHGFKKLISVMNIGAKDENEEIQRKNSDRKPSIDINHRDKKQPTARFGNGFSSSKKTNEEKIKNIFMFEKDNEDYNDE